jgi:SAM-dependent methyltransferase
MPSPAHLAAKQRLALEDFEWLRSHVSATGRVLEIGSSEGSFLDLMARAGWRAVGVEPSAFAEFGRTTFGLDVRRGLFEDMSFPEAAFDLVVALRVLEHVSDPRTFLRRVAAVVETGGLLYLEVPSAWKPRHRLAEFLGAQHLRLFTKEPLRSLLASEGFNAVILDERGRGLRVLARRVADPAHTPKASRRFHAARDGSCDSCSHGIRRDTCGRPADAWPLSP